MPPSVILGKVARKVVFTFRTTADAMQMEKLCKDRAMPGRLIPVPGAIQAGCGMCWAAPVQARAALEAFVTSEELVPEEILEISL